MKRRKQVEVILAECGSASRHGRSDSGLVSGDDIEVTLHHHRFLTARNVSLGPVEAVKKTALLIDPGVSRVEVLRAGAFHRSSAEPDRVPAQVMNRKEDPVAEDVIELAPSTSFDEARALHRSFLDPPVTETLDQRIP